MGYILSIETSTPVCSVALHKDRHLVASKAINVPGAHAERLMGLIHDVFAESNVVFEDIGAIAVSEGPGSYTGLRIGVSTAKGLAFGWNIPLIGVSTLQALAVGAGRLGASKGHIVPMLDARRMEVYREVFDSDLNSVKGLDAEVIDENAFRELLSEGIVYFIGDGSKKVSQVIAHPNAVFLELEISAEHIGEIASWKFQSREFADIAYFTPNYLKEFKALHPKKNPLLL